MTTGHSRKAAGFFYATSTKEISVGQAAADYVENTERIFYEHTDQERTYIKCWCGSRHRGGSRILFLI